MASNGDRGASDANDEAEVENGAAMDRTKDVGKREVEGSACQAVGGSVVAIVGCREAARSASGTVRLKRFIVSVEVLVSEDGVRWAKSAVSSEGCGSKDVTQLVGGSRI